MSEPPCFVYAICHLVDGSFAGPVKIGVSAAPAARLRELQTGCPHRLAIAFCAMVDSRERAMRVERAAHQGVAPWAMSGEWFDIAPGFAVGILCGELAIEHGAEIIMPGLVRGGLQ